ncbi:MAG: 30S ribosomal protein S27ae [Candidatus Aenigmarchaeota archaeon]|nr:30S ribosomal protein S27ae [Candidatus Aenigmarchaeota archaeon]
MAPKPKPGTEEKTEAAKPKKAEKEKKSQKERKVSKKKHAKVKVWKFYDIGGEKIRRKNQSCPRCGAGTFMATYKERSYCGKCGYAEMKEKK